MNNNIGVVLVTYNRLEKLRKAIECYDKQTFLPTYIIVVNNASTDGTKEFLASWEQDTKQYSKYVVTCETNTGGSGGFYKGIQKAIEISSANWIWVADDDAYTEERAFEILNDYLNHHNAQNISAVCGKVTQHGVLSRVHRKNIYCKNFRIIEDHLEDNTYDSEFEINSFTYVGTAMSLDKLLMVGLPNKDYFIWYDDAEHSMRLSKVGKIICLPQICIEHDNQVISPSSSHCINWKKYYGIRNSYDFYKKYFPKYVVEIQFTYKLLKCFVKAIIKNDYRTFIMYKQALLDAKQGNFGKSDKYYPGMKM